MTTETTPPASADRVAPAAPGRHPVVDAARALVPMVRDANEEIDTTDRLPGALVEALSAADLFRMFVPAEAGGPEIDPLSAMAAVELLAAADASVGWCVHVSSGNAWQTAALEPAAVRAMAGPAGGGAHRFSGSARPLGTARPVEGGYVVDGRWDFASNCLHAQWYCGTCVIDDRGDGGAGRRVRAVPLFVPITAGEIVPTWRVAGLRATGSHDVMVHDVFVPAEHVCTGRQLAARTGALYHRRLAMVVNWALTAGVGLGVARGALEAFGELSARPTAGTVDTALRDRATVQGVVGRASSLAAAARAYCTTTLAAACAGVDEADAGVGEGDDGGDPLGPLVREARLAIVHAMQTAVEVVDLLFHAGGTQAVFERNRLERYFRDAHVAAQHAAGSPAHFEAAGRLVLGLPANAPFW